MRERMLHIYSLVQILFWMSHWMQDMGECKSTLKCCAKQLIPTHVSRGIETRLKEQIIYHYQQQTSKNNCHIEMY